MGDRALGAASLFAAHVARAPGNAPANEGTPPDAKPTRLAAAASRCALRTLCCAVPLG